MHNNNLWLWENSQSSVGWHVEKRHLESPKECNYVCHERKHKDMTENFKKGKG